MRVIKKDRQPLSYFNYCLNHKMPQIHFEAFVCVHIDTRRCFFNSLRLTRKLNFEYHISSLRVDKDSWNVYD